MTHPTNGIPVGYPTVTPYLIIRDAASAIEFYKKAFGATELLRITNDDGTIMHAEIKVGDSPVMIGDDANPNPDKNDSRISLHLYVEDVDRWINRAVSAGAKLVAQPEDKADGDRRGGVDDPFGFTWWMATQLRPISREEMQRHADAAKA
jgi:PhnB protein